MAGVLLRRNAIVILMSIELMLNAVNISFVAFSSYSGKLEGQIMVFFVMTIAAAEAAVLPVLAQITVCAPSATAWVMAAVMPRSLNEPVGLSASYLM
mgnify:CR=1 FL=1